MFCRPGPSGLNGAYAGPKNPGLPESDQRISFVGAARPTKGGTDGTTGPCKRETTDPRLGLPPSEAKSFTSQPVMHWKASCRSVAPTTERMIAQRSIEAANCGKHSPI